jgi:CMP-N-acetylneuraminic acid synthetase
MSKNIPQYLTHIQTSKSFTTVNTRRVHAFMPTHVLEYMVMYTTNSKVFDQVHTLISVHVLEYMIMYTSNSKVFDQVSVSMRIRMVEYMGANLAIRSTMKN